MAPAIPDRWIPYKACGSVIEGTRLICFKVPLKKNVQKGNRKIKEIWDIPTLLSTIPNLGAVIDLTNTKRYYNPQELLAAGIQHKKILMPGRIIPPKETVEEFTEAVDEFLGKDGDFLIGVHCTHGLNRTGYMVCRYMRDRLNISPQDAIAKFEKARGYEIERENYKADLLGKKPPPPDLGRTHTVVKPIDHSIHIHENPEGHTYNGHRNNHMHNDFGNRPPWQLRHRNENNSRFNNYGSDGPAPQESYVENRSDFRPNNRPFNRYNHTPTPYSRGRFNNRDFRSNWRDRESDQPYRNNDNNNFRRNGSGSRNYGAESNWRNEGNGEGESSRDNNYSRWNGRGRSVIRNRNNYRNAQ